MADFECSSCGHFQLVDDKHIGRKTACPKCKTQGLVVAPANSPTPRASTPPAAPSGEIVFYDSPSAFISNTRAVINGVTYSLSNITSVRCTKTVMPNWSRIGVGCLCIGCGLLPIGLLDTGWSIFTALGGIMTLLGIVLVTCVLVLQRRLSWKMQCMYRLTIGSAGGEKHALQSEHVEQIAPIVEALNKAIVSRG
jgi:hypothetical protein